MREVAKSLILPEGEKNSRNDYPSVRNQRFLTAPLTRGAFGCGSQRKDKLQFTALPEKMPPKTMLHKKNGGKSRKKLTKPSCKIGSSVL
jgi:hypothetical protein